MTDEEIKFYENRIETLEAKNKELLDDLNEMKRKSWDNEDRGQVIRSLRSQIANSTGVILALQDQRDKLSVRVSTFERHDTSLQRKYDSLYKEMEMKREKAEEAINSIRSLNGRLLAQRNATKKAQESLTSMQLRMKDIEGKAGKYLWLRSMLLSLIGRKT